MQPKFSADEKVLCYHGPLLYEAKILKNKKEGGSYNYFVHYQVISIMNDFSMNVSFSISIFLSSRDGTGIGMSGLQKPGL